MFFILLALLAVSACDEEFDPVPLPPTPEEGRDETFSAFASVIVEPPPPESALTRLQISPDVATIAGGQRFVFTAVALDSTGRPIPQAKITWKARPEAGRISDSGFFTAAKVPGSFRDAIEATATFQGVSTTGTASLEILDPASVSARTLHTVGVYPSRVAVLPGQVVGLSALGWDEQGRFVQNIRLTWSVIDPRIGRIDSLGFFTAGAQPGEYVNGVTVTAIQEISEGRVERQAFVSVSIREGRIEARALSQVAIVPNSVTLTPGQRAVFFARAFDQTGRALGQITYDWTTLDSRAGRMERPGQFVAGQQAGLFPGSIQVQATQQTPSGPVLIKATASVIIRSPASRSVLAAARITPGNVTALPSQRLVVTFTGFDSQGRSVPSTGVWRVEVPEAGTITASGAFTAGTKPGFYKDAIRLELVQDQGGERVTVVQHASVSVIGKLARLEVRPQPVTVASGQSTQLQAVGYDSQGIEIPSLRLRWTVEDPRAGRIDRSGRFTAGQTLGTFADAVKVVAADPVIRR